MVAAAAALDRTRWTGVTWFAFARVRTVITSPSHRGTVVAEARVLGAVGAFPVGLTITLVWLMVAPTVDTRNTAVHDSLTVWPCRNVDTQGVKGHQQIDQ